MNCLYGSSSRNRALIKPAYKLAFFKGRLIKKTMKKEILISFIGLFFLIVFTVSAGSLYDYYIQRQGFFPSIGERAEEYESVFNEEYKGTAEQNIELENYLATENQTPNQVLGGAPMGAKTIVASSTKKTAQVGPQEIKTIFSAASDCISRIITTLGDGAIMLTFATSTDLDETVKPTGTFGHLQAASTTAAYDSGLYGCDVWQVYGFTSTTLTISEFKGFR